MMYLGLTMCKESVINLFDMTWEEVKQVLDSKRIKLY